MRHLAQLRALQSEHPALKFRNPALLPASVPFYRPPVVPAWHDPWAERNEMLRGLDIPSAWARGLLKMSGMCPPDGVSEDRWADILDDVDYLAKVWGGHAARLGWSDPDLFGCSPALARRLDRDGLAMLLDGREVIAMDAAAARIANRDGSCNVYRRRASAEGIRLWEA